jgi:hypothetical protein
MAVAIVTSFTQQCDGNGVPLNAGTVEVYAAETTTPLSLYPNDDLTGSTTNPITLDSSGRHAIAYIATAEYKIIVKNSAGTTVYTRDNIDPGVAVGSGALPVANGGTGGTTAAAARTNLSAASSTDMATAQSDISNLQTWTGYTLTTRTRWASGTTAQQPAAGTIGVRYDSTTGRFEGDNGTSWRNFLTAGDTTAADMFTGTILQVQAATPYTSNTDLTTVLPSDNTIPQITEGTEILTLTFTPKHASSSVWVYVGTGVCAGASGIDMAAALFKNSEINAIAATAMHVSSAGNYENMPPILYKESPGSVSPVIYSVRVGPSTSSMRLNGTTGARVFGGVAAWNLWVIEVRG